MNWLDVIAWDHATGLPMLGAFVVGVVVGYFGRG